MFVTISLLFGCHGPKETGKPDKVSANADQPEVAATAHVLVYRTKVDHRAQVPVLLSADGSTIISYPHPRDVNKMENSTTPVELGDGWLLDRRGIGLNVGFLRTTYSEYAILDHPPSVPELEALLVDRDPLTDLCDCGPRNGFSDPVAQLSSIILHDSLSVRCKRLK